MANGPNPWDPQVHDPAFYGDLLRDGSLALGDGFPQFYRLWRYYLLSCAGRIYRTVRCSQLIKIH